jgi:mannitol-specific phosphotransferase system IIBC component
MNNNTFATGTRMGTAGGTLTILLANINSSDIFKTIVMAAIGATVSFLVSQVLRRFMKPPKSP